MTGFSVDPRIFQQLGALLVKRDSIALTELIKNAYDADARVVRVAGHALDGLDGSIVVEDDGVGMTTTQFSEGFLRVASRSKQTADRQSPRWGRRYTGEKGVGRLAAHKLAAVLDVRSVAMEDFATDRGTSEVTARIDWDRVEDYESLSELGDDALLVHASTGAPQHAGTTIRLQRLRRAWSEADLRDFTIEADLFEPPAPLTEPLPRLLVPEPLLFDRPLVRDSRQPRDVFEVLLEGDFEVAEKLWQQAPESAWWVVEIDSTPQRVRVCIAPTPVARDAREEATVEIAEFIPEHPEYQPTFQARIFAREGATTRRTQEFASQTAGIRVYMEGFRIAPYGERGDDWLELDRDYARRVDYLNLQLPGLRGPAGLDREGLRTLPNNSYVGAVLLTHRGAPELQAPVNREGFLPGRQIEAVGRTVRNGIDLLTRVRAGLGLAGSTQAQGKRALRHDASEPMLADEVRVRDGLLQATDAARGLRAAIASGEPELRDADALGEALNDLAQAAEQTVEDRSLLRVLAAAGTQMAAFIHEIENVVAATASIDSALERLARDHLDVADDISDVRRTLTSVRRRIEWQAGYLTDVTTLESRRRRERLPIAERLERAWELVHPAAERLGVHLDNRVPKNVRTPPIYRAELATVLTNLLSNAVKAAGRGGRIVATGGDSGDHRWLRFENTGTAVDLKSAERWFRPYQSTTLQRIDPLLGQGMGLGLPITRSMLHDYNGTIQFVVPNEPDMATAVEIRFPS